MLLGWALLLDSFAAAAHPTVCRRLQPCQLVGGAGGVGRPVGGARRGGAQPGRWPAAGAVAVCAVALAQRQPVGRAAGTRCCGSACKCAVCGCCCAPASSRRARRQQPLAPEQPLLGVPTRLASVISPDACRPLNTSARPARGMAARTGAAAPKRWTAPRPPRHGWPAGPPAQRWRGVPVAGRCCGWRRVCRRRRARSGCRPAAGTGSVQTSH